VGRLLQAAKSVEPVTNVNLSAFDRWAASLSDEDSKDVEALVADNAYCNAQVASLINEVFGQTFTTEQIRRRRLRMRGQ
jgi:long-subunit acyl-CoA synthetase (AMP-forming)